MLQWVRMTFRGRELDTVRGLLRPHRYHRRNRLGAF